jgi:hypothetical protein
MRRIAEIHPDSHVPLDDRRRSACGRALLATSATELRPSMGGTLVSMAAPEGQASCLYRRRQPPQVQCLSPLSMLFTSAVAPSLVQRAITGMHLDCLSYQKRPFIASARDSAPRRSQGSRRGMSRPGARRSLQTGPQTRRLAVRLPPVSVGRSLDGYSLLVISDYEYANASSMDLHAPRFSIPT